MASPLVAPGDPSATFKPSITDTYGYDNENDEIMSLDATTAPTTDLSDSGGNTDNEASEYEDYAIGKNSTSERHIILAVGLPKQGIILILFDPLHTQQAPLLQQLKVQISFLLEPLHCTEYPLSLQPFQLLPFSLKLNFLCHFQGII